MTTVGLRSDRGWGLALRPMLPSRDFYWGEVEGRSLEQPGEPR